MLCYVMLFQQQNNNPAKIMDKTILLKQKFLVTFVAFLTLDACMTV